MKAKLVNAKQLRDQLTNHLNELQSQLNTADLSKDELTEFLSTMIEERGIIMEEYDYKMNILRRGYHYNEQFQLILTSIDDELYNSLGIIASRLNLSLGVLLSVLMELYNENFDNDKTILSSKLLAEKLKYRDSIRISHCPFLKIKAKDLEDISQENLWVKFSHIKELDFSNVPLEVFLKSVASIEHCKKVILPSSYPKYLVYYKAVFCKQFEFNEN